MELSKFFAAALGPTLVVQSSTTEFARFESVVCNRWLQATLVACRVAGVFREVRPVTTPLVARRTNTGAR